MAAKKSIYNFHLKAEFGDRALDDIGVATIARFRAGLVEAKLSDKRAVLSKILPYAADAGEIASAPKVGLRKLQRPESEFWDFAEYARILGSAKKDSAEWYAAVCLAGAAGPRVGEVRR